MSQASATPSFQIVGHDFIGGLGFINGNVRAAIAENGDVIFAGTTVPSGSSVLFVADGVHPLNVIDYSAAGYTSVPVAPDRRHRQRRLRRHPAGHAQRLPRRLPHRYHRFLLLDPVRVTPS